MTTIESAITIPKSLKGGETEGREAFVESAQDQREDRRVEVGQEGEMVLRDALQQVVIILRQFRVRLKTRGESGMGEARGREKTE